MRRTRFDGMQCSIARSLDVVGEWWTLLVLRDAFRGVRRFEDFQRHLGIARNVLSDRLQTLVDHGIFERRRYQERPPRDEYRLTEKGLDLYPVIVGLLQWGDKWAADDGPPVILRHKGCGAEVTPVLACPACGDELSARDMAFRDAVPARKTG